MEPRRRVLTVVLDTETTGLGRGREDGVVQVAAAWRRPGAREVEVWAEACDPGRRLWADGRAAEAFRVNRMSEERLARARGAAEVAADLRARLRALEAEGFLLDLRAYNLAFDRPFLEAEPWSLRGPWGPCLMLEAHARLRRDKWPRLPEACAALGVPFPGEAHSAEADAHAALLVHEAMQAPVARAS